MKTIEELLKNLARPEVLEFGLVTNRLPSVNIGGKFEPVDDEAPTTERLMQMLVTMGGVRYVDSLTDKPVQWTTRLDGVGVIAVAAILRKDIVQARFTVAKREGTARSAGGVQAADPVRVSEKAVPKAQPVSSSTPAVRAATPSPQPVVARHPTSGVESAAARVPSGSVPAMTSAKATAQILPQVITNVVPVAVPAASPAAPPDDEWDDDDEPTLQTLSPPVSAPRGGVGMGEPRAKPSAGAAVDPAARLAQEKAAQAKAAQETAAREAAAQAAGAQEQARAAQEAAAQEKAAEGSAAQEKAAQEKAAQEKAAHDNAERERAAQENAAQEKAAQEKAAQEKAAQEKAAQEKAAQEKAAQEKAAQEKAAQDNAERERAAQAAHDNAAQEKAAQDNAAQEKAAQDTAVREKAAREKAEYAAEERAARERALQERRVAQERIARERAAAADALRAKAGPELGQMGRRISTPTSVDAVDVEITTADSGSGVARPQASGTRAPPPAASPTQAPAAPVVAVPEQDRPQVDAAAAVDSFLAMAVAARATDLHIVAGRPVLLRVATDLLPRTQSVPAEHVERIARDIVPPRLREALDRDGSAEFAVEHPTYGRFRVNVSRQHTGYKLNLRVIPKEMPTLASLGLPEVIGASLRHQRGLILVSGPTSQGKSCTLAALVDHLNRETTRHILTIEEPVEHVHVRKKGVVSQQDVGLHTRSKARAIQSALRQDVDVIVIGELRDVESVRLALTACESGRLVLAAMATPSAAKTVEELLGLFGDSESTWARTTLASSLRLVIGQRLVPSADRTRLHAAVELLPWSVALYGLVRAGRTNEIAALQARGIGAARRLDASLAELIRAQKITLDVAKQVAHSPTTLEAEVAQSTAAAAGKA